MLDSVTWFTCARRGISYQRQTGAIAGVEILRSQMTAIARALSRASGTQVDVETLKTIAIFCGVGLLVSLLLASGAAHLGLAPSTIGLLDVVNWI
jgi:hypothetical protein